MRIRHLFLSVGLPGVLTLAPALAQHSPGAAPLDPARPAPSRLTAGLPAAVEAAWGHACESGVALTLSQALQAAQTHPQALAAGRAVEAARADVRSADRAPAPLLSTGMSSIDLQHGAGAGPFWARKRLDKSLGLDWTWERGNKRGLRTEAAERLLDAAQADQQTVRLQQHIGVLGAFYELLAAQERLHALQALAESARTLALSAQRRLAAGDVSAQDAARSQIEAERAQAEGQSAQLAMRQAQQTLSVWTGQAVPAGGWRAQGPWPTAQPEHSSDIGRLTEQHTQVVAARERLAAAQAALKATQALRQVDPTLGATVDHYPDGTQTHRLMALRLSFPLHGDARFDGEIGRAQAQRDQAQDLLEQARLEARAELHSLQQAWQSQGERLQAHETRILPQARQVAAQAELAYRKGGLSLTDLLDARRALRAIELDTTTVRKEYAQALGVWQLRSAP